MLAVLVTMLTATRASSSGTPVSVSLARPRLLLSSASRLRPRLTASALSSTSTAPLASTPSAPLPLAPAPGKRRAAASAEEPSTGDQLIAPPSPPTLDVVAIGLENVLMPFWGPNPTGGVFRGLPFSMNRVCMPYYILTSVSKEKASRTLTSAADFLRDFTADSPRLLSGDRLESIRGILSRMPPNSKLHYVDSDVEALKAVADAGLGVDLYYAAWSGESDPRQVLAESGGKIALLQLDEFAGTMQWGFGLGDQLWDTYLVSNDGAPMEPKGKI